MLREIKMKKQTVVIVVLVVLLVGAFGYIGAGEYNKKKNEKNLEVFGQGAEYGYEQAVVQMMNVAAGCDVVPLRSGNSSINLVAVECLQQGGGQ